MSSHNFNINSFDFSVFEKELAKSGLDSLFDYHVQNGTNFTFHFTQALDQTQLDTLTNIATNHPCLKCQLALYLEDYRWRREIGGTVAGGVAIPTDRESQAKLIAVRIKALEDANYTVDFKTPAGFVTLDAPTGIFVADAAQAHVQSCFSAEAAVYLKIEDDTLTTESAVDSEFEIEYAGV